MTDPLPTPDALAAAAAAARSRVLWEDLPRLVGPARPPRVDRETEFLRSLRRHLAQRRQPETRALLKTLGRHAGARIEEASDTCFPGLFTEAERGCLLKEVFTDLVDGGLAAFRGPDAASLLGWVQLVADRALLRAAVGKWALDSVRATWRAKYRTLLTEAEADELGADVLGELLGRALARFEGTTAAELYVYVRTTARRAIGKAARRAVLDRDTRARMLAEAQPDAPPLVGRIPPPPRVRLREGAPPISVDDQRYLEDLLAAGGKLATVAEQRGVTRGSVTRMVQRILGRLDALPLDERERVGEWAEATLVRIEERRVDDAREG